MLMVSLLVKGDIWVVVGDISHELIKVAHTPIYGDVRENSIFLKKNNKI